MAFDYKKEYKEFYMPKNKPAIVTIPKMNYIAVRGKGNPNDEGGEYQRSIELLYGIAYTIKMSYKSSRKIKGFFEYIVPPLEGFWWQDDVCGVDYSDKSSFLLDFGYSFCRILCPEKILTGQCKRRQRRKNWIVPALNF